MKHVCKPLKAGYIGRNQLSGADIFFRFQFNIREKFMIDESGMVEYLKLNRASDRRPELALAVVQALGGQYAFELLHDNITKHGVNKQLIKDEYGEFDRSWEQSMLGTYSKLASVEHCEEIVKA